MSGHLGTEELTAFLQRSAVDPQMLLRLDRHLAKCGTCRSKLRQVAAPALPEVIQDLEEPLHLSYEQISGFLDNSLPAEGREAAALHLSFCSSCKRELDDLKAFEKLAEPDSQWTPAPSRSNWLELVTGFLQAPYFRLASGLAMVLGIVLGLPVLFHASGGSDEPNAGSASLHNALYLHTESAFSVHPLLMFAAVLLVVLGGAGIVMHYLSKKKIVR